MNALLFKAFIKTEIYFLIASALASVFGFLEQDSVFVGVKLFVGLNLVAQPFILYAYKDALIEKIRSKE